MASQQGVPFLLLLRVHDDLSTLTAKGYAIIPQAFKKDHPEIVEIFSRNNFKVMSVESDEPYSKKKKLECTLQLFEAELNSERPDEPLTTYIGVHCKTRQTLGYRTVAPTCLESLDTEFFKLRDSRDIRYSKQIDDENLKEIGELLSWGVKIEYGHHKGGTILHFAVKRRHTALLNLLLKNGASSEVGRPQDSFKPLCLAAKKGFEDMVELLLSHQIATTEFYHRKLLNIAFDNNRVEAFKVLLDFEVKVSNGVPCNILFEFLRVAVGFEAKAFVVLLLNYCPVDAFFDGGIVAYSTVLFGALSNDWYEVVRKLVEIGIDINRGMKFCDVQPLGLRHTRRDPRAELLKGRNLSVEDIDEQQTPLTLAAGFSGEAIIALLLKHGADVNVELGCLKTPMYYACRYGNVEGVKLLLAAKANIQQYPELLNTAVKNKNVEIVELLLLNGVPRDPKLLFVAAGLNNPEIVELLLMNRVVSSAEDAEFKRCVSLVADVTTNFKIMEILFKFGADLSSTKLWASQGRAFARHWGRTETPQIFAENALEYCFSRVFILPKIGRRPPWVAVFDHPNFLACHVIKQEVAKVSSRQQDVLPFWLPDIETDKLSADEYRCNCLAEIDRLKNEKVGDTGATFFDILTKNVHQLARYAKYNDYLEIMQTGDYKILFPIYASVLGYQFEKGAHRRKLLRQIAELGSFLGERFSDLLDIINQETFEYIVEEILGHLSDFDLEILNYDFSQRARKANEIKSPYLCSFD